MRKEIYRMPQRDALEFLEQSPTVHIAASLPDGSPVMRTVHGVVVDGYLAFHGAPAGEKTEAIGRPAVACSERVIAPIPSYFVDRERACPATTYYLSVQAHGVLEEVTEADFKTRVLTALMHKFQPEGGHVPLDPEHPLYRNAIKQILVVRLPLDRIDGKAKLGQNRTPEELISVLDALWRRGLPGDPHAIELIRKANSRLGVPSFLQFPHGLTAHCFLGPSDVDETVDLIAKEYWNIGVPRRVLAESHLHAGAWVGARDSQGKLVASARAVGDIVKNTWIYDVIVSPEWRGRGLGKAIVKLLLDHPAVRRATTVRLGTRDAQTLYEKFGFVDVRSAPLPFPYTAMVRRNG